MYDSTAHGDLATSTDIWDDQTGETVASAFARFSTFGDLMTAEQALALPDDTEVMSFGYGDDPVDFDGIDVSTLREALAEGDTIADLDRQWGPFAVWAD